MRGLLIAGAPGSNGKPGEFQKFKGFGGKRLARGGHLAQSQQGKSGPGMRVSHARVHRHRLPEQLNRSAMAPRAIQTAGLCEIGKRIQPVDVDHPVDCPQRVRDASGADREIGKGAQHARIVRAQSHGFVEKGAGGAKIEP